MKKIYLDYAAATPVHPEVLAAMLPFYSDNFYNPSATYLAGLGAKHSLENARAEVAQTLGARNSEIVFTAGGTESTNLAINGVMQQYPKAEVLVSAVEHEAVLAPAAKYNATRISVDAKGMIILDDLERKITDNTVLISVMYANNEVGTIQPIRAISQIANKVRNNRRLRGIAMPLFVHSDACQAALYLDLHVSRLNVDLMTLNGGKMYGPKQSGILYSNSHIQLRSQIIGGGQERGMRSGTENVAQAVGFAKALVSAQKSRHERFAVMEDLQKYFMAKVIEAIPQARINGSRKYRLPNNVHIVIPGQDNERLLFALDERGVMAAAGSACSASDDEPSHVLRAMGLSDEEARSSLRFTMGELTTKQDIDRTIKILTEVV